ncbi:MAG: alginate export family protein [Planctomycetes bacterium]|nr:alginate export family protein [Planctomycetota bacterium]
MNIMQTTTSEWFQRGSLLLASTALLGGVAAAGPVNTESGSAEATAAPAVPAEEGEFNLKGLKEKLQAGRFWMNFRYRFENVDQVGITKDARASTLRTRLGYESADYKHWKGLIEFSDVSGIPGGFEEYNDTINGQTDRPVVADPQVTVVNQLYASYDNLWDGTLKIGRQRIKLDNDRFIGNVGWRQTEQTFDAVSYVKPDFEGVTVVYAYIDHINRIFGPTSVAGDLDSNSHALNVSKDFDDVGKLTAYGYYLDVPDAKALNTFTYGLRLDGSHAFDKWTLLYTGELAHQNDVASNPNKVDAGYMHGVIGAKFKGVTVKGGYEVLEGGTGGDQQFSTPLATAHAHQGWADQFLAGGLNNPINGMEDLYLLGAYKLGDTNLTAVYHEFSPETGGGGDYGTELDLQAVHTFSCEVELGVKFADYDADNFGTDTQKFWAWLAYSF